MAIDVTVSGLNTVVDVEFAESPSDIPPETYIALRGEKGDTGAAGQDGTDGVDGADGFSPIATVSKVGDTATISITDANGTTTASVSDGTDGVDGQDGRDGIDGTDGEDGVGIVSITKTATVGLVDTYTILFTDGTTTTYEVTNGANGTGSVADVWQNGVSVLDGDTAKVTVPTDLSDLNNDMDVSDFPNDAGYITGYTETDPVFTASAAHGISLTDITNWNGKSDFSGDYNDLTNKPTIPTVPTNVSAFTNDAGYLTSYTETDPTVPSWAKEASKPSYAATEISGLADYVVENGTTGMWTYRKWKSGVYEAWGKYQATGLTITTSSGGTYYGGTAQLSLPSFNTGVTSVTYGNTTSQASGVYIYNTEPTSGNKLTITYRAHASSSNSSCGGYFHVIGTWA